MQSRKIRAFIVVETALLGLAAMGVFAFLNDQYAQVQETWAQQTAVVQATEFYVAMLTATPPTRTPTRTPTSTPTFTATPTATDTATPSVTPSATPTASITDTPVETATAFTRTPGVTGTPGPTRTPGLGNWVGVAKCITIDDPGAYRLTSDLTTTGDCITVQASRIVLDCAGHSIRGTGFAGYGIALRKYGLLALQSPNSVEVRNCRLSNFRYGIFAEAGKALTIRDNNSSNNFDDTDPVSRYGKFLGMTDGGGIRLENVSDAMVTGNTTLHQAIGIDIQGSNNIKVRNNNSSDNSAWGINFARTLNSEASGNTTADNVRQCTWGAGTVGYGCDAGGIAIQDGSSGNTISNNSVTGRNGNGVFIKAHAMPCGNNNSIVGNTITSVLYNAVELGFCTGNRVNGNLIRDGLDGIWLGYAHDTEIRNNTISNMRNHGVISSNSRNNTVSGNQIISSNEGLYFFSEKVDPKGFSWLPGGDYSSHDNCLCANTFQGNLTAAVHLLDSTSNQVTNNTFKGNGRNILIQGKGDGNNTTGNTGLLWPSIFSELLARAHSYPRE